jgi:hypothetical protein
MDFDKDKVDDAVLALLYLTLHDDMGEGQCARAWKGHNWDATNRLFEKGLNGDPQGKAKSVVLTPEGKARSKEMFFKLFGKTG